MKFPNVWQRKFFGTVAVRASVFHDDAKLQSYRYYMLF